MTGPAPAPEPQVPMAAAPARSAGPAQPATDARAATSTGPPGTATGPPAGFASVLNSHVARTALAEGQKNTGANPSGRRGDDCDKQGADAGASATTPDAASLMLAVQASLAPSRPGDPTTAANAATTGQSTAADPAAPGQTPTASLLTPPPAAADAPVAQLAGAVADAAATTVAAGTQTDPGAGEADQRAAAPAGPTASTPTPAPAAAPAATTPAPSDPKTIVQAATPNGDATPSTTATTVTAAAPNAPSTDPSGNAAQASAPTVAHSATPTGQHAPPGDTTPAQGAVSQVAEQGQTSSGQHDPGDGRQAPAPAAVANDPTPAATRATDPGSQQVSPVAQPTGASAPPTPIAAQPATQPAAFTQSAGPAAAPAGVDITHAIETVRMTVAMAARQGYSQARIQLSPESLGGINIQLRQTQEGLVARVMADHPEAARTLQQGGAELRRSLESAGISLLRLDIGASDERGTGATRDRGQFGGETARERRDGEHRAETAIEATASQPLTVQLGNGTAVNVLA